MTYIDLAYPQPVSSPKIVPEFEAHFTDPSTLTGPNSALSGLFDGGFHVVTNSGVATPLSISNVAISGLDEASRIPIFVESGVVSFLRSQYDFSRNRNTYGRGSGLSNADTSLSQDFVFNRYTHYEPNPAGGQGLLDQTSYAVQTDVTYSRNINILTYSPYSS
jgi:hypothetical protein